ncbi:partner of numb [Haematobia irritans]|uniref:partner of numb n=1 Tax=Haematobia irritans TaxID=7368 RepID=UPI003F506299
MTAIAANFNVSSDLSITPSRKRKRHHFDRSQEAVPTTNSCFTNEAFSSTPKKLAAKRRLNKENANIFGLEEKSISDIAKDLNENKPQEIAAPLNPYEVVRPPKKKQKPAVCFENPALNLNVPEKQFNPYEIVREPVPLTNTNCFVNPALNLKSNDEVPASRNPFEIQRETIPIMPCKLKIGLPFVPNVGCRIDFKDMSMSQITPTKLLAEKLVFSPVVKSKTSLGSIGEETMDIGKELDRYQLELENSINEAKLRKNGETSPLKETYEINVEQKISITHTLTEIKEDVETEMVEEEIVEKTTQQHTEIEVNREPRTIEKVGQSVDTNNPFNNVENLAPEISTTTSNNPFIDTEDDALTKPDDLDELYGPDSDVEAADESFDFKAPAPFVRAYTKPTTPKLRVSKESLEKKDNHHEEETTRKSMNVKNMIRKSIRKLMHPNASSQHKQDHCSETTEEDAKHTLGLINTIRQSLRRKPPRHLLEEEEASHINECELSILDGSERTMKLKSDSSQTEYVKIEDLTNEKKHNIRNSIRRSTRDMGHHLMKTVFHKKHEEYEFR